MATKAAARKGASQSGNRGWSAFVADYGGWDVAMLESRAEAAMLACPPLWRDGSDDTITMLGQRLFLAAHEASTAALAILAKEGDLVACRRHLVRAAWCYALDTRLRTARAQEQVEMPIYGRGAPLHLAMGHLCAIVGLRDDAVLMARQTVLSEHAAVLEEIDAEPEVTACTRRLVEMIEGRAPTSLPEPALLPDVYGLLFRSVASSAWSDADVPRMLADRLEFSSAAWGNLRGDRWFFSSALAALLPLEIVSLLSVAGVCLAGAPTGMPCVDVLRVDAWPGVADDPPLKALVEDIEPFLSRISRTM